MNLTLDEMIKLADAKDELRMKAEKVAGVPVLIFTYMVAMKDTFDSELAKEFRGVTFRGDTGECICRPLPKFFNIGEREDTLLENLDMNTASYYNKHDGSMATPVLINDKIYWKTKKSFYSDVAHNIQTFWDSQQFTGLLRPEVLKNVCRLYTPVFEYVGPENRIVLEYDNEDLMYLGIRCIANGRYTPNVDNVEWVNYSDIYNMQGIEGFVIQLKNGGLVKAKTKEYIELHRVVTNWTPKQVIKSTLDETIDDMIAVVSELNLPGIRAEIEKVRDEALLKKLEVMNLIENLWDSAKCFNDNRKSLAGHINKFIPKDYRRYMFLLADDKDISESVNNHVYDLAYAKYKPA